MTKAIMVLLVGIAFQLAMASVPAKPDEVAAKAVAVADPGGLGEVYKTGGIVGVLLVLLAVVYLDGRKRQAKLEVILEENARATQAHADATRTQAAGVFEMSQTLQTVVTLCAQARGVQLPPVQAPRVKTEGA